MKRDLVCEQEISGDTRYFSDYADNLYYFCSPECKRKFDDHPDQFIREQAKEQLGI